MSTFDAALHRICCAVDEIGMVEASRLSGVPYSTLAEARRRDFSNRSVAVLRKLAELADQHESAKAAA